MTNVKSCIRFDEKFTEKTCSLMNQCQYLPQDITEEIFKRLKQRGICFLMTCFSHFSVQDILLLTKANGDMALCLSLAYILQLSDGLSFIFGDTQGKNITQRKTYAETFLRSPWASSMDDEQEFNQTLENLSSNLNLDDWNFCLLYASILTNTIDTECQVRKIHDNLKSLHRRMSHQPIGHSEWFQGMILQLRKMAAIFSKRILQNFVPLR